MTLSHYSHHFKAVLVAGRKWDRSLEHKTGFGEGVAHENTDVIQTLYFPNIYKVIPTLHQSQNCL